MVPRRPKRNAPVVDVSVRNCIVNGSSARIKTFVEECTAGELFVLPSGSLRDRIGDRDERDDHCAAAQAGVANDSDVPEGGRDRT